MQAHPIPLTNSPKKCPRKFTQKFCPREFTYFVHKNSPFMSTRSLPPNEAAWFWYQMDQTGRVRQRGRRIVLARNGAMPASLGRQNASAIAECRGHTNVYVI